MTRQEQIADYIRGAIWINTAEQGESWSSWEELSPGRRNYYKEIAKHFEQRLAREGFWIVRFGNEDTNVPN